MSFWTTFLALNRDWWPPSSCKAARRLAGWTAYPPLSGAGPLTGPGEGMGQSLWILSIAIFCGASLDGRHQLHRHHRGPAHARAMTLMRMPLTCWTWWSPPSSAARFRRVLSAGVLLLLDRTVGTSFFLPGGMFINDHIIANQQRRVRPLLWQHLFLVLRTPRGVHRDSCPAWASPPNCSPPSRASRLRL